MVKKYNVLDEIDDELGSFTMSAGLYSFSPFHPDKNGYTVFKIGVSMSSVRRRVDNYITYYPKGVYYNGFLTGFQEENKIKLKRKIEQVEKEIFYMLDNYKKDEKSKMVISTQRIKNNSKTEWIYTKAKYIDEVFDVMAEKYNLIYKGYDNDFNLYVKNDFKNIKKNLKPYFKGEILFY